MALIKAKISRKAKKNQKTKKKRQFSSQVSLTKSQVTLSLCSWQRIINFKATEIFNSINFCGHLSVISILI